ncbi:hypothetical protein U9M48_017277 [Paspalum notatum var. saurae]|uniref:NADH:ubiquinone reductase (non-electrogenic) n=1 Tax=Paspalum notatum var. saurae TaxID=547442 RepID=A0AAQ3WNP1_PASNO
MYYPDLSGRRIERDRHPAGRPAATGGGQPKSIIKSPRFSLWLSRFPSCAPAMAASSLLRSLTRHARRGCAGTGAFSYYRHQQQQLWSPFSTSAAAAAAGARDEAARRGFPGLGPTAKGEKARVVVLGTGWAGSRLMKDLNTSACDVVCVAPRNHMVFTPLLASTCVGTLEFRSVAEPLARIQPAVSKSPGSYFLLARCTGVDPDAHTIDCETVTDGEKGALEPWKFKVAYDKLVFACGAEASTFGIHGVTEHAIFLREVHHAQEIRRRLLLNLMLSDVPGISEEEKRKLLHCVVVGGGPTGVEFSGELSDFILRDVKQRYSHVKDYINVTLIEANEILSSFDVRLRQYATNQLIKFLCVHRIGVDEWLRVPSVQDVYAIGDCSGFLESTGKDVLPALAQVAERQGKYLASLLNHVMKAGGGHANSETEADLGPPFVYKHLGSMATVGRYKALVDLRQSKESRGISIAGFVSFFIWRSAYLTRVISWRNRFYVAINWLTTLLFGRDISRI